MKALMQAAPPLHVLPWMAYAVAALIVWLAITFPYDALRTRVLSEIGGRSGFHVNAAEWHLEWPFGFTGHRVTISQPRGWDVTVDRLGVSLSVLSLLASQPRLQTTAVLPGRGPSAGGLIEAKVTMSSMTDETPTALTGRVDRVDLTGLKLTGVAQGLLYGTVEQQWRRQQDGRLAAIGDGAWDARIDNLILEQVPLGALKLPTLTLSNVAATVRCKDMTCQLLTLKGEGPDGSFTGSGNFMIGPSLAQTNVDLSLVLAPAAPYVQRLAAVGIPMVAGPMTVKVSGSLLQPAVSL